MEQTELGNPGLEILYSRTEPPEPVIVSAFGRPHGPSMKRRKLATYQNELEKSDGLDCWLWMQ